jgi:hypothetical protein
MIVIFGCHGNPVGDLCVASKAATFSSWRAISSPEIFNLNREALEDF